MGRYPMERLVYEIRSSVGVLPGSSVVEMQRRKRRLQRGVLIGTLVLSDALAVSLALLLAWYIRIGSGWIPYRASVDFDLYRRTIWMAVVLDLLIFALSGLYDYDSLLGGTQEYSAAFRGCSYGVIALIVVSFFFHSQPLSRGWLLLSWVISLLFVGGSRFLWRRVFQWLRRARGWLVSPTLIVGVSEHGRAIARQLLSQNAGVRIVGFVDEFLSVGTQVMDGIFVLGTPRQVHELALRHGVEQVILLSNAVTWETFQEIIQQTGYSNGYQLHLSPGFYEILTANVRVTDKAFVPLLRVEQARIVGVDWMLKTALDYTLGGVLFLTMLPLMALIAAAILLADGRPIFVRHRVLGLGGKPFRTIKFRTDLLGATYRRLGMILPPEIVANPRLSSRVGRFLYRTGLDKLPQLFDVLWGHLSLVGPRTSTVEEARETSRWHPSFLTVKPGWTGPWAVGGAQTLEDEKRLTLYYIRNWTIWLDLRILYQTVKLAVRRRSRIS